MNPNELAQMMLKWSELQADADALKKEIEQAVLQERQTTTVGNIVATYRNPRKSYDYEGAVRMELSGLDDSEFLECVDVYAKAPPSLLQLVDWKKAAEGLLIADIPYTEGEASVSLRVK